MTKKRVYCFIDGFNLFHALDGIKPKQNYLKWLDLRQLAQAFLKPSQEDLQEVMYFSAYPTWRPGSYKVHQQYVAALQSVSVKTIMGKFKEKDRYCRKCNTQWIAHEEKESDVNLAVSILHHAHLDNYDKAFIITSDSDLKPPIELVKNTFPKKEITVLIPPNRYNIVREFRNTENLQTEKIKLKHLKASLLPNSITTQKGKIITIPDKYRQ